MKKFIKTSTLLVNCVLNNSFKNNFFKNINKFTREQVTTGHCNVISIRYHNETINNAQLRKLSNCPIQIEMLIIVVGLVKVYSY